MALATEWSPTMNKMWSRMAISFLVMTWIAIGVIALMMRYSVQTNFGTFLHTSNSLRFGSDLMDDLKQYYVDHGNWDGVEESITLRQGQGSGRETNNPNQDRQGIQLFVADANQTIVYATDSDWLGQSSDAIGPTRTVELTLGSQTIGYLGEQTPSAIAMNTAEAQFIEDTTKSLLLAAVGSGILAIALGIFVGRGMARPLQNLTEQVSAMTTRDLGRQIKANGTEETAQLAGAFNNLSARLAEAEQRRSRMTADIAHELRTPVTVMRGHFEAMMDGVYPMDGEHLAVAYDQTLHLARLVEDLSLLTKAESGQLSLNRVETELFQIIDQAVVRFQPLADDINVRLTANIADDIPDLPLDSDRFQQVLDNLLTNALRHTPEGGTISISAKSEPHQTISINIHNTGKPITDTDAAHVFDRFWRAQEARERDAGGTGLGLAITKQLIHLHGGTIAAQPQADGTTFRIMLPVHQAVG